MLTTPPAPTIDNLAEIADFVELDCLKRRDFTVSHEDLVQIMLREHDVKDETLRAFSNEVFGELERRGTHTGKTGTKYPFRIENRGALLRFSKAKSDDHWLYLFLLFATRLNMKSNRNHARLDGTVLFERLCAVVADRFWGGPSAEVEAHVFGTGRETDGLPDSDELPAKLKFGQRVDDLCKFLGEGCGFKPKHSDRVTARDGKLDVVVVRRFADHRSGTLIGFGQCKTGTHWGNDVTKLQPVDFAQKWMTESPAASPVRMYFVSDRITQRWYEFSVDAGILFDRCRILQYSRKIPAPLIGKIAKWSKAAAKSAGFTV